MKIWYNTVTRVIIAQRGGKVGYKMELLQLRYFYESAQNESIAKTAEAHMVPASSVSASIKRLEDELGAKLFDRHSNKIVLNENGKAFQRACMAIFTELETAAADIKTPSPKSSEIKILILSLRERMATAMIQYQKKHPEVLFNAVFNANGDEASQYDLIIDKDIENYYEYKRIELCSYRLCFRTVADSPLVGKELTMKDLRHQPFVTMEKETELNSVLFESCKAAGFYPNIRVMTNDPQYYKYATQAGIGISLWRKYSTPQNDNLVNLTVSDFYARQTINLYYKLPHANTAVADFIEFLNTWGF